MAVLDSRTRKLQADCLHTVSHNVLSREDLRKLYASLSMSKSTPQSYLSRLMFTIGIVIGMRPSALCYLRIGQFCKVEINDSVVRKICAAVINAEGSAKTAQGGWKCIGSKPVQLFVYYEDYEDSTINFFAILSRIWGFVAIYQQIMIGFF